MNCIFSLLPLAAGYPSLGFIVRGCCSCTCALLTGWVGGREGVLLLRKFSVFYLCIQGPKLQGSKGGASWKGGCLGCDESFRLKSWDQPGVGSEAVPGSAWLQIESSELMKKQVLLLQGTSPRAGCWHRKALAGGNHKAVPAPQGCVTTL